jgi:conjugal transfer pilus assembly protein TrbC
MRLRLRLFATLAGTAMIAAALLPAIAQTVLGVEVGRIREDAKGLQAELTDFIREVSRRGNEMTEEASAVQQASEANADRVTQLLTGEGGEGPFDFDEMLSGSRDVRGNTGSPTGPLLIAFVSTSMPPESLRQVALDVTRAGGIMVFRGFPNNNPQEFGRRIAAAMKREDATDNVGIDPRLFRAFNVEVVPTYVVTTADVELCDGLAYVSHVPPHDRISGNVSIDYALRTFSQGSGPGAPAARVFLRRYEARGRG